MIIKPFINYKEQECSIGKNRWNVLRLIALSKDLEVMTIPIKHLNILQVYDNLTLKDFVGHIISVNNADLDYPIILDENGEIMDGRHRIMKALLNGIDCIKAVRFDENPKPCWTVND